VGASVALLFWLTRERFYLWFACTLILQASFLFMNIASELQAWSLYFNTDIRILTDLLVLVTYIFLISLLGFLAVLVYRFARTSREQQRLASALQAAHDIQNRLVPVNIPALGGLRAEIAYRAAEEVGGDFCQILPRPDGSILVAIGDVSGKGLQAAMLGAVAVGALRSLANEKISPAAVLERLNHVLLRTENSGFVTCLCLVLTSEGEVVVSNAGHLAPYLDGAEISVEPGLPLGILAGIRYSEDAFVLPGNARLTLLSDGVVEARSGSGELFGFERTCEVSQLAASEIADRAYQFGQEDDITVITLDWRASILAAA
jgi:serine phosphatase RsbU (regulator of sigma subunit)